MEKKNCLKLLILLNILIAIVYPFVLKYLNTNRGKILFILFVIIIPGAFIGAYAGVILKKPIIRLSMTYSIIVITFWIISELLAYGLSHFLPYGFFPLLILWWVVGTIISLLVGGAIYLINRSKSHCA